MLTLDVAINLLSDAIWELGLKPLYQASASKLWRSREQPPEIEAAIERGAEQLAAPGEHGEATEELWSSFLASWEVRTLVLDLFTFKLADRKTSTTPILGALTLAWIRHAGLESAPDMTAMFERFDESIQRLINAAAEAGILAIDRSRTTARKRILAERLAGIAALDSTTPDAQQISVYERFAGELRNEVAMRYGKIEPPNLLAREAVELERLFVPPRIDSPDGTTDLPWFVESIDRRVVLGNPGAGKSTLAAKICRDLALSYADPAINPRRATPWCIELRRLATGSEQFGVPLADLFTEWAEGSYQLSVPDGAFEWLLSRGRLLVVFDGLDELLNISTRQDVRNAIESFCRRYTTTPVLITSRIVGYHQAPLDEAVFDSAVLLDFDQSRVELYARQWFAIRSGDEPVTVRLQHAAQFIHDTAHTKELRNNPLMLGLLASLYRGPGSIPRNLPDVYDSCATLLFSTWDKLKGLEIILPFAEHIRPALRELAWWMFTTPKLGEGVTRPQAVERTADYLEQRRFGSAARAHTAAEHFIDFCRGRAWVFTDQGSTATNEDLFGFTHRTFLEFFSAEYLAYRKQSAEELVNELMPFIAREERDVVARIALQIKARMYPDGADDIIIALLDALETYKGSELAAGVGFLVRLLQGVIPSPAVARGLGSQIMVYAAKGAGASGDLYAAIAAVGDESRVEIARGLVVGQRELLRDRSSRQADIAADLIFYPRRVVVETAAPFWEAVGRQTRKAYGDEVKAAAKVHLAVALAAWPSIVSMQDLIGSHKVQAAFCPVIGADTAPVRQLLASVGRARGGASSNAWSELGIFGESLAATVTPWFDASRAGVISLYQGELVALAKRRTRQLLPDQVGRITICLISICVAEAFMRLRTQSGRDRLLLEGLISATRRSGDQFFASLSSALEAGTRGQAADPHELTGLDLPGPIEQMVADWSRGEIRTLSR
jgi:NACHT domain